MTDAKKTAKRIAVEKLDAMAKDPAAARAELVAELRKERPGITEAELAQEIAIVEHTLGI